MVLSHNLKQRLLFSFFGILLILTIIYYSPFGIFKLVFTSMIATVIALALWEFYRITQVNGYRPQSILGIGFSIAYIFALYLNHLNPLANAIPEAVLGLTLITSFLYFFIKGEQPFVNLAITFFGIFYLTIPLGCLVSIDFFFPSDSTQDGRWWLLYVFSVTKMTDTGAYFSGKMLGKTKLAPYISPKKTWEGALGGFVWGTLTSYGLYLAANHFYANSPLNLTLWQSLWVGATTSLLAQLGDLSESLLKRDMKVKDSNQLPGLGGFLDIVDSLVFTTPFIYVFLKFL
jgi:phosphatidate cytidylyltransferase